jgi:hypothetical protein
MTVPELMVILLDGPFLSKYDRINSMLILIEHYRITGAVPVSQSEMVLVHG